MSRPAAIASSLAVGVFAFITTGVGIASEAPPQFLVADLVGGLSFLLSGLAAVWLRPRSPAGPMLITCAALWFVGSYAPTGQPVVTPLGFAFERYYDFVLAALLLLLSGGLGRASRALMAVLTAAFALRTIGRLLLVDPSLYPDCEGCPPNPFALWPDLAAFETIEILANGAIAVLALVVGGVAIRRLLGSTAVARRARWPILITGSIAMAAAAFHAAEYAWSTATGTLLVDLAEPWAEIFAWSVFGLRALVPIGFLVATLRLRGQAGPLAPLAAELGRSDGSGTIGDALRTALGDASLMMLRPATAGGWLGEDGHVASLPSANDHRAVTLVGPPDAPVAAIVHEPALLEHPELLDGVVRVLGLALENTRLEAEVRDQLQAVTDSRARIVAATEAERRRLERDLHDGAQQRLIGVALALQQVRASADAQDGSSAALRGELDAAANEVNLAIRELRELARGIHPAILEEEGVGPAVAGLARRASLPVEVRVELDARLPRLVESTVYFTIAEALTNAQRHAQATKARVHVARTDGTIAVEISDDGAGGADPARGSGLRGLADRVAALGGSLTVDSQPGAGTRVRATIPVS
jgi:signal transduction histidine kinase